MLRASDSGANSHWRSRRECKARGPADPQATTESGPGPLSGGCCAHAWVGLFGVSAGLRYPGCGFAASALELVQDRGTPVRGWVVQDTRLRFKSTSEKSYLWRSHRSRDSEWN